MHREGKVLPLQQNNNMNTTFKLFTLGAIAAASVEAQATLTLTAEYDTAFDVPLQSPKVTVTVTDLLTEEMSSGAIEDGYNSGMSFTVTPLMGEDEAIRTLTIPKMLQGNYYVEYLNNSTEGIGLSNVYNEGDNLYMVFSNATFSFTEGKVLEFNIYSDIGAGVADLDFNQNLDIRTQSTYVAYENGDRAWTGGMTTLTSSQNYAVPSDGFSGTLLPEPSSVLYITMATLPLIFRRKRAIS